MATRQYIGARYVPKFYQNSVDGSTQWESNVVYDPLTYVTLTNGHMYISKKQVPATIGSPVSNIEYWLDIGSYNGFIEQLQDEIDTINNTTIPAIVSDVALKQNASDNNLDTTNKTVVGGINELNTSVQNLLSDVGSLVNIPSGLYLHGKNVVVYGDSTVVNEGTLVSYMELAADAADFTVDVRAVGGTRMNRGTDNGTSLINDALDLSSFDYCFLVYGTNEWQAGESAKEIKEDVDAIIAKLRQKAPNIGIIFITPFYSYHEYDSQYGYGVGNNIRGMSLEKTNMLIQNELERLNVAYIDLYHRSTCDSTNYTAKLLNDSGGIYVHPNPEFKKEIAQIVLQGAARTPVKNNIGIFTSMDFLQARKTITAFSEVTALSGIYNDGVSYGCVLKLNANGTAKSMPHFVNPSQRYRLRGITTGPFTITFSDGRSFEMRTGDFDIDIDFPFAFLTVTISAATQCYINDFQLYAVTDFNDINLDYNWGQPQAVTLGADITASIAPKIEYRNDCIHIGTFDLTLATDKANGANAWTASGILTDLLDVNYIVGYSASGNRCIIQMFNNVAVFIGTTVADTYLFTNNDVTNKLNYI